VSPDPCADTPIACGLDAAGLADRVEEWRALVASSVVSVDADETSVRLLLDPSDAALVAAVSLAQREKQCCPFFAVALDIATDRRTLSLTVPPGAEDVMASFAALLRP
jgi:anti-sigma-K factor RskA